MDRELFDRVIVSLTSGTEAIFSQQFSFESEPCSSTSTGSSVLTLRGKEGQEESLSCPTSFVELPHEDSFSKNGQLGDVSLTSLNVKDVVKRRWTIICAGVVRMMKKEEKMALDNLAHQVCVGFKK